MVHITYLQHFIPNLIHKKPPINKPINLAYPENVNKNMKGQYGQPMKIENVLKNNKFWKYKKKQGFFIEAGASKGEFISNTLYFELKHNWTGLLVEPNPDFLKELKTKNRNAWILPHCLSTNPKVELLDFDASAYNGGLIQPGKVLPSDLGRTNQRDYEKFPQKTMKVNFLKAEHNELKRGKNCNLAG